MLKASLQTISVEYFTIRCLTVNVLTFSTTMYVWSKSPFTSLCKHFKMSPADSLGSLLPVLISCPLPENWYTQHCQQQPDDTKCSNLISMISLYFSEHAQMHNACAIAPSQKDFNQQRGMQQQLKSVNNRCAFLHLKGSNTCLTFPLQY